MATNDREPDVPSGEPARPTIRFDVLTLFPGIFSGYLGESLLNDATALVLVRPARRRSIAAIPDAS